MPKPMPAHLLPIPEAEGGKRYHMARLINQRGGVSPWCAPTPKAINLKKHQTWTIRWEAVTCPKCLRARAAKATP
jgi:hypothetical protein